ncbi:MAG: response regulator transcription factor [Bacteroidia bacterium]|nr:response regulator transcription factor [Bacteroidia bacterium]
MKVLIIEDEILVSNLLKRFLKKIDPHIEVLQCLVSVKEAVEWFNNNPEPDLVLLDIQLSDGICFKIFDEIYLECPVIFITGFNEYAIQAFKVNSIDYLLKPVELPILENAIQKFNRITKKQNELIKKNFSGLLEQFNIRKLEYKSRFLVKSGTKLISIPVGDIAYFCTENRLNFIYTTHKKRYLIDRSLDEIIHNLDPAKFYRINRQFIVSPDAIASIHNYFNNRLKLELNPPTISNAQVIISSKKVPDFKQWLDK